MPDYSNIFDILKQDEEESKDRNDYSNIFDISEGPAQSIQDNTSSPNVVIPEIDPDATLNSGDFYSRTTEKDTEDPLLEISKKKVDTSIDPATGEKWTKDAAAANMKLKGKKSVAQKPKNLIKEDEEILKAWLNVEYFGKGAAQKVIGTTNLSAYKD